MSRDVLPVDSLLMEGDGALVVSAILGPSGGWTGEAYVADASINVDTDGLKQFADNVGFYATEIDPVDVGRSKQQFAAGVTFGVKNASGAVHVAKQNYARALATSLQNLAEFVEAARVLAEAAEATATDFKAADSRSAAALDDVNRRLFEAAQASASRQRGSGAVVSQGQEPPQ
jgi:hypothetical protein